MSFDFAQDYLRRRRNLSKFIKHPILEANVQKHWHGRDEHSNKHLYFVVVPTVMRNHKRQKRLPTIG